MLVIDASVAIAACHTPVGFARFRGHVMIAPQLMILEASSVFHEMSWREEVSTERAKSMLMRLLRANIEIRSPKGLTEAAWDVADELGWAKTCDAQYVALARMLDCKLVSIDERFLRGIVVY